LFFSTTGCDDYDVNVRLERAKLKKQSIPNSKNSSDNPNPRCSPPKELNFLQQPCNNMLDLNSPMDSTEITSFNKNKTIINASATNLKSPDENYFSQTPQNRSPSNIFRSEDCNELLGKELDSLNEEKATSGKGLVSQNSIEIAIDDSSSLLSDDGKFEKISTDPEYVGEVSLF
jgi:hypothetical protein